MHVYSVSVYNSHMTNTPEPNEYVWGTGIRVLRGLRGLTQTQLADVAGTTQVTISRIETNGGRPSQVSDALRVRIARALDVNAHDLFPYLEGDAA